MDLELLMRLVRARLDALIIQTIDALAAKQARLERALAAVDPDAFARGDEAGPALDLSPGNIGIVPPPKPEPAPMVEQVHGLAGE